MSRKHHWERAHADRDPDEQSWFQAEPVHSLALIEAVAGPHARVIDVGGGASRLADVLLARGYEDVTVLDIAGSALDQARARLGDDAARVRWIEADVLGDELGTERFDVWHDRAVFHFLTEAADRARYVDAMHAALAPDGYAIVAAFAEDGPERCSGLPVMRYSAVALADELGDRFELERSEREEHTTPAGKLQPFTYCVLRKR